MLTVWDIYPCLVQPKRNWDVSFHICQMTEVKVASDVTWLLHHPVKVISGKIFTKMKGYCCFILIPRGNQTRWAFKKCQPYLGMGTVCSLDLVTVEFSPVFNIWVGSTWSQIFPKTSPIKQMIILIVSIITGTCLSFIYVCLAMSNQGQFNNACNRLYLDAETMHRTRILFKMQMPF